jgi:hypothetical protein
MATEKTNKEFFDKLSSSINGLKITAADTHIYTYIHTLLTGVWARKAAPLQLQQDAKW